MSDTVEQLHRFIGFTWTTGATPGAITVSSRGSAGEKSKACNFCTVASGNERLRHAQAVKYATTMIGG